MDCWPTNGEREHVKMKISWLISVVILLGAAIVSFGFDAWGAVQMQNDAIAKAVNVLTVLFVVALFLERASAGLFRLRGEATTLRGAKQAKIVAETLKEKEEVINKLKDIVDTLEERKQKLRAIVSMLLGFVVALAGVRTLGAVLDFSSTNVLSEGQRDTLNFIDIVITSGLLAGGSDGIAALINLLKPEERPGEIEYAHIEKLEKVKKALSGG